MCYNTTGRGRFGTRPNFIGLPCPCERGGWPERMSNRSSRDPPDHVLPAFFPTLVSTPVACRRSRGPQAHTIADWLSFCCGGVQYCGRRWRPNVSATVLWGAARSGAGGWGGSGWVLQTATEILTFSAYYLRTPPFFFLFIVNGKQGKHSRRRAVLRRHDMCGINNVSSITSVLRPTVAKQ